jgi:hypothetical protein
VLVAPRCESAAFLQFRRSQASKVQLGQNQTITTFYNNLIIVHVNHLPLVLTLVCGADANLGHVMAAVPELKAKLEGVRSTVSVEVPQESGSSSSGGSGGGGGGASDSKPAGGKA